MISLQDKTVSEENAYSGGQSAKFLPEILLVAVRTQIGGSRISRTPEQPCLGTILIHRAVVPSVPGLENLAPLCKFLPPQSVKVQS